MAKQKKSILEHIAEGTITMLESIPVINALGKWAKEHISFADYSFEELSKDSTEEEVKEQIDQLYNWAYEHVSFAQVLGHKHGSENHENQLLALAIWANENTSFTEKIN